MSGDIRERLGYGFGLLTAVLVLGTAGYWGLGSGRWDWEDCLYMTVITLTTVGYGEVLEGFGEVEHVRIFTVLLIVFGMGVFVYFASTLTAFIIEGDLRHALEKKRMRKRLATIEDHIVVCGAGATGQHVVNELLQTHTPMVVVDNDAERIEALVGEHDRDAFPYVIGDATDDCTLLDAGIERARGLVAALASDKDNLYLVVSARQLQTNPRFRIVARCIERNVMDKLQKVGADSVVSPNFIGGMRLASEIIRPTVVRFLDQMLHKDGATRISEVTIDRRSKLVGKTVREADIRRLSSVSVLAVREAGREDYVYNPSPDLVLRAEMTLVVLGTGKGVAVLREIAG